MKKKDLKVGDILQLKPEHKFGGMLVIVTEPKSFGCQGYLMSQFNFEGAVRFQGVAYVRPTFEQCEFVGHIHWLWESIPDSPIQD
jgi:hypothetical protein